MKVDQVKFRHDGALGCSNSHFVFRVTTCCAAVCVEDEELGDLYTHPNNLSLKVSLLRRPADPRLACPFCRVADWNLVPVDDVALHDVNAWRDFALVI